jgi:hypothetical protein
MKIKLKIECKSCNGTGVYVGLAERDGAGVVCHTCKGTGCQDYNFTYTPFKKRQKRKDIKRVFIQGYGYCVGTKPITLDNGVFVDFSKEGVSYEEFLAGKMPEHIKQMGCPMLADQSACHDIKGFIDQCEKLNGGWIGHIPSCKCKDKMACWERFTTKPVEEKR